MRQKTPSLPTLISLANYLDCNLDYLPDRTDNPISINKLKDDNDKELNELIYEVSSLPKEKRKLVDAFIKWLNSQKNIMFIPIFLILLIPILFLHFN